MADSENKVILQEDSVLDKSDLRKCFWRLSLFGETSLNYERMQAVGFLYALLPALKKIYTKKEDLSSAMKRHLQFFNTQLTFGNLILGPAISMEEQHAKDPDSMPESVITNFKTSMMGPVAAVGDAIDWGTLWILLVALGAGMALEGNTMGVIIFTLYGVFHEIQAWVLFRLGYHTGRTSLISLMKSGVIGDVLLGANILGMFMTGVLASSYVTGSFALEIGDFNLQNTLDGIAPGLLPLATVFICYWLIHYKKVSTQKLVFGILIVGIIGSLITLF